MGKGEERQVDEWRALGLGAYRYPQPAITIPDKREGRPTGQEWRKISRQQPVDVVVNGRVLIKDIGVVDIRLGIEEKTCSSSKWDRSNMSDEQRLKWLSFCKKNCMVPVFVATLHGFRGVYFYYNIGYRNVPPVVYAKDGYKEFSEFAKALILEIVRLGDAIDSVFDVVDIGVNSTDVIKTVGQRGEDDA